MTNATKKTDFTAGREGKFNGKMNIVETEGEGGDLKIRSNSKELSPLCCLSYCCDRNDPILSIVSVKDAPTVRSYS